MTSRRSCFILDKQKVDALQTKRNLSDSAISLRIKKHRGWLGRVKNTSCRIKMSDAKLIAEQLSCTLQEIGADVETGTWNPVGFDYEREARGRLESMLPQDAEIAARVLRFLQGATQEQRDDLVVHISDAKMLAKRPLMLASEQWWKVLYISKLCEILVQKLDVCSENDLLDCYKVAYKKKLEKEKEKKRSELKKEMESTMQKLIDEGKSTEYAVNSMEKKANEIEKYSLTPLQRCAVMAAVLENSVVGKIQTVMDDATIDEIVCNNVAKAMREMVSKRLQETINDCENTEVLQATCEVCAEFLVAHFEILSPERELRINQFKKGIF